MSISMRLRARPSPVPPAHGHPRRRQPADGVPCATDAADHPRSAERRLRAAGGPQDSELHACRCGALFPASPTTSVSCPLCGTHQAW